MANPIYLTDEMIDEIQNTFASIDSEWGPVTKEERVIWGNIMRRMYRLGYLNWWYRNDNKEQKWY